MTGRKNEQGSFNHRSFGHGNGNGNGNDYRHEHDRRPWRWRAPKQGRSVATNVMAFLFFVLFSILFYYSLSIGSGWINHPTFSSTQLQRSTLSTSHKPLPPPPPPLVKSMTIPSKIRNSTEKAELLKKSPPPPQPSKPNPREYPPMCTRKGSKQTCPNSYRTNHTATNPNPSHPSTCPDYFKWIHEDLRPWKETGVKRQMVEAARRTAHFRLVILGGRVYVEKYKKSLQTRDKFTLWGFLQLLRWYPGRLPDLELMFDCDDRPVIQSNRFRRPNMAQTLGAWTLFSLIGPSGAGQRRTKSHGDMHPETYNKAIKG